jgi:diaminopimelate dehydrogenase
MNNKEKIKVAVVGYGNVGKATVETIKQAPDMDLVQIVEKNIETTEVLPEISRIVVKDISEMKNVDVAILSLPSRAIPEVTPLVLNMGIRTVDSFDIHTDILDIQKKFQPICEAKNTVSIVAAGWDPGIDSVIRGLFLAMAPKGITHTNYGPGMSMGHTCAVKAIKGVKNALSITVPIGMGIHKRMVYVELEDSVNFEKIEKTVKTDPYFVKDETYVFQVKDVDKLIDVGHGVKMERSGVSGVTHNQKFSFECRVNNPALTAQVMVSAARATMKQKPGCYTLLEIPVIDFLHEDKDDLIKSLV